MKYPIDIPSCICFRTQLRNLVKLQVAKVPCDHPPHVVWDWWDGADLTYTFLAGKHGSLLFKM